MSEWVILALLIAVVALCRKLYTEIRRADGLQEQMKFTQYDYGKVLRYVETVSVLLCEMGNTPATWTGSVFRCSGCGAIARDPVNLDHKPDCVIGRCERLGIEGRYLVDR